jgi:hypothetical protein
MDPFLTIFDASKSDVGIEGIKVQEKSRYKEIAVDNTSLFYDDISFALSPDPYYTVC